MRRKLVSAFPCQDTGQTEAHTYRQLDDGPPEVSPTVPLAVTQERTEYSLPANPGPSAHIRKEAINEKG